MNKKHTHFSILRQALAVFATLALAGSLAACGSSSHSSSSSSPSQSARSAGIPKVEGISLTSTAANGEPTITFVHPKKVTSFSVSLLRSGTGTRVKSGQRLCFNSSAWNARTGKKISSTWKVGHQDCSVMLNNSIQPSMLKLFTGARVGSIWAFAIPGSSSGSTTSTVNNDDAYITVMQLEGARTDPTRATGTKVTTVPANLPRVTLAANGKPSINMNGYKSNGKLVAQTLLQGNGTTVTPSSTVLVQYSGWLLSNGKSFDSSWNRGKNGEPIEFPLSNVVKGWQQGLKGQKVGSQVLLIVPPSLGYGSTAQKGIPANSTLVFVIDILAAF
jgi:peptidylprolyl isomerase